MSPWVAFVRCCKVFTHDCFMVVTIISMSSSLQLLLRLDNDMSSGVFLTKSAIMENLGDPTVYSIFEGLGNLWYTRVCGGI